MSKVRKKLNLSFIYGLISQELQELWHQNFFVILRLDFESSICHSRVALTMRKVRKAAKKNLLKMLSISRIKVGETETLTCFKFDLKAMEIFDLPEV